eukprot:9291805-Pyramimonas_sp.AAC.1
MPFSGDVCAAPGRGRHVRSLARRRSDVPEVCAAVERAGAQLSPRRGRHLALSRKVRAPPPLLATHLA